MMTKGVFLLLAIIGFVGCKDNERKGLQFIRTTDKGEIFKVRIVAKVTTDDNFAVYYTTDGGIKFLQHQVIWVPVTAKANEQNIIFDFPKNIIPTEVRIDLGKNPKQQEIYLSKVVLAYNGKAIEIPGTLIFSYFRPNVKVTDFDATTGMIKGKMVNGVQQSPSLYPKEGPLRKIISQLTE